MAKKDPVAMCIYGRHRELAKDAYDKQRIWKRTTYASWKRNEAKAQEFREKFANKNPRELLYV